MSRQLSCFITMVLLIFTSIATISIPLPINADINPTTLVKNDRLIACPREKSSYGVAKKVKMIITGYSSTEDQTDDTPFITASGKYVRDGIIANNMLPFGTKLRIPELYGEKVFIVEDRMNQKKGKYQADIWFPERMQAKEFGAKLVNVEVLVD